MNTFVPDARAEKSTQKIADFTVHSVDSTLQSDDFTVVGTEMPLHPNMFSVCHGCPIQIRN